MQTEIVAADVTLWWIGKVDADVFAAWGQVGGAIATFAAVVVALWIGIRDGRRAGREAEIAEAERGRAELERQRAEHDRARAERERAYLEARDARLFLMDVGWSVYGKGGAGKPTLGIGVDIENLGNEIVLDYRLDEFTVYDNGNDRHGTLTDFRGQVTSPPPLLPGESRTWFRADVEWPDEVEFDDNDMAISICVSFRDPLGRRWRRTDDGEPVRVWDSTPEQVEG